MKKMTIEQIRYVLKQMEECQEQNPKAIIKLEIESGAIVIEFPLPKDYFKITKFGFTSPSSSLCQ